MIEAVVVDFERFGFDTAFEVDLDPEFPGDGDWGCPVYGFDRLGRVVDPFVSPWGTPVVVMVRPVEAEPWVGMFPAGGVRSLSQVFACPRPTDLGVMAEGDVYVVSVLAPEQAGSVVAVGDVQQVAGISELDLLLFVRSRNIVAIGPEGLRWETSRLGVDDLRLVRATSRAIVCTVDNLGGNPQIELNPVNGEQTAGTHLDSFWPPEALT